MKQQNLKSILDNLSPNLKKAFYSDRTSDTIKDAIFLGQLKSDTNKLNTIIEGDIIDILLGRSPLNTFLNTLKSHLNVPETSIVIINKVIQQRIFEPLKNDLNQLKINRPEFNFPTIQQKKTITPQKPLRSPKIEPIKTQGLNIPKLKITTQAIPKPPKPLAKETFVDIPQKKEMNKLIHPPDLSLPEAAEVSVKKPEIKTTELKNFSTPTISLEQQEKIKNKLLSAMQRRTTPPKVVETIKQLTKAGWKKVKQVVPKEEKPSVKIDDSASSQVFSGKGGKSFEKELKNDQKEKTPYIFDVKLKEEQEKKEELPKKQKSISYSKYKPKNPFGKA